MKIEDVELKEYEMLCKLIHLGFVAKYGVTSSKKMSPIVDKAMDAFYNLNKDYQSTLLDHDENGQYFPNCKMEAQLAKNIEKILEIL